MLVRDLKIYRGDSISFVVSVLRNNGTNPYSDRPLRVEEVDMLVRPLYEEPLRPKISVSGNRITITFEHDLTKYIQWTRGAYDLQIRRDGVVQTVMRGNVLVEKDVTL